MSSVQVPVRTYEELFFYINRVRENEKDVFMAGKVEWLLGLQELQMIK